MKTINHGADHRHRWRPLGAHALHVGSAPNNHPTVTKIYRREVRTVFVCMRAGCAAVRVSISRHDAVGPGAPPLRQRYRTGGFRTHIEDGAALCRRNGWGIGTMLENTDLDGKLDRLQITALGESSVLIRYVRDDGSRGVETGFDLTQRLWREVPPEFKRRVPHHTARDVVSAPSEKRP